MADKIWPGGRDDSDSSGYGEPDDLGGLWGEEDPEGVEIEFHSISDEEFAEDIAGEEEEKDGL